MKKIFKRLCVTVLSFLMVVSSTTLPAFGEDINYNGEDINYNGEDINYNGEDINYNEKNDIANSFRYSNGHVKERGYANYAARASVNSGWPDDSKAICKGIDVSHHNGTIDWKRVKQSEVEYAIIRCGFGSNVKSQDDKKWEENVKGCTDNNIPYGVYLYSYADTVEKASSEADHAIRLLEGKKFKYPVYYDLEENKVRDKLTKQQIADIAQTFCDKLSAKGYTVGIYANKDWFTHYLTDSRFNNWTKWVAQYNTVCNYQGKYDMWQCSSTGSVPGISGRVDLNYSYSPFENSGGVVESGKDLLYVKNGVIDESYTQLTYYNNNWYYFEKGVVNYDYTGLAIHDGRWYYVEDGVLNWNYTGLTKYYSTWYMVVNGQLDWNFNDLILKDGTWYCIRNGVLDYNYTGLAIHDGRWYYVEDGVLNWNYTGLTMYHDDWYMVTNGQLDWSFTDLTEYYGTWYMVVNGRLDWNFNDLILKDGTWYCIRNGVLDYNYTGLAIHDGRWYYVDHGKLDWNYTGLTMYYDDWYMVTNGQLDWNFTDLVYYYDTWYCVRNGVLDWNYTGLAYHAGGWYYINHGVLDWGYTGFAQVNGQGAYYEVVNGVMINGPLEKMRNLVRNESSPTQYIILVDRAAHRVGIFRGSKGNWQDVQYYQCCVGKPSTPTVSGTFYVGSKGKYFNTGSRGRCWYYTQITGNYLFHSVIYDRQNTPRNIIDNSMDKAVSHGCVRLDLDHAKWIYDNIPRNTKIIIY